MKGPDRYPPILPAIIKIARFMVVKKALKAIDSNKVNEIIPCDIGRYDDINGNDSSNTKLPPASKQYRGCLDFVTEIMDAFMVHGTHSPMQWMLVLHRYGLNNSDNIWWDSDDESLLY